MSETYAWRGGREMLLRHGAGAPITLLILPALFEEANRMRRFTVTVMRALSAMNIGSILPDLPGTGESLIALTDVRWADWHDAVSAVAETIRATGQPVRSAAIRGGAIMDGAVDFGWRLAPENGERVLRDLVRATALSRGSAAGAIDAQARIAPTVLAGTLFGPEFYTELIGAAPPDSPRHTSAVTGTILWRAAEPGEDAAFAAAVATDIAEWTSTCATP